MTKIDYVKMQKINYVKTPKRETVDPLNMKRGQEVTLKASNASSTSR